MMQIVWDQTAIKQLQNSHTLLELETFDVKGTPVTCYCVVPAEKIFKEIASLDSYKTLHAEFLNAYKNKDYQLCQDLAKILTGKFGGELDSFYEEILKRIFDEPTSI